MRPFPALATAALTFAAGVFVTALVLIAPALVHATDTKPGAATCSCPQPSPPPAHRLWPKPKLAEVKPHLDVSDELAALEAVHLALTEVGDGSSYVWHRRDGFLSGIVKPTASFKDAKGRVCRHIELSLAAGDRKARTEGVACRLDGGRWALEG